jgi:ABC-type transport system involved in cytochrome bd biosynthesis fused ATPase/permease subunit
MRSYTITPVGVLLLIILAGALVLAGVGPASVQAPAFVVGILILLFLVAGSLSGGRMGRSTKSLQDRRAEYGAKQRDVTGGADAPADDSALWQRERERREERETAQGLQEERWGGPR